MYSRSFFFVVSCETISLTWAIIVPNSEAADMNRKMQKICRVDSIKISFRGFPNSSVIKATTRSPEDVAAISPDSSYIFRFFKFQISNVVTV
jgi:hypothetical protein